MNKKAGSVVVVRAMEFNFIPDNGGSLHLLNTLKLYKSIYEKVYLIDVSASFNIRDPFLLKRNNETMDWVVHITIQVPFYLRLYFFIKCLVSGRFSGTDFWPLFLEVIFQNKLIHEAIRSKISLIDNIKWVVVDYLGISWSLLRGFPNDFKLWYLSHNFESEYWIWNGVSKFTLWAIEKMEGQICDSADCILCISESDWIEISRKYNISLEKFKPISFVYDDELVSAAHSSNILSLLGVEGDFVLFIGSWHPQNKDAISLIERLAESLPDVNFIIAWSACVYNTVKSSNVFSLGLISESDKFFLLSNAALALNPSFQGSWMATKLIEFFAWSIPVITTRLGVRWLNLSDSDLSRIAIIAETDDDFLKSIILILKDADLRKSLSQKARRYFEEKFSISSRIIELSSFF